MGFLSASHSSIEGAGMRLASQVSLPSLRAVHSQWGTDAVQFEAVLSRLLMRKKFQTICILPTGIGCGCVLHSD